MLVPLTLITPVPLLIRYKSPPPVVIEFVLSPTIALSAVLKTNVPGFTVWLIGSLNETVSSNRNCALVDVPLSISIPEVFSVTPAPVSPLLSTIILSTISNSCELTTVCVPAIVMLPVHYRLQYLYLM